MCRFYPHPIRTLYANYSSLAYFVNWQFGKMTSFLDARDHTRFLLGRTVFPYAAHPRLIRRAMLIWLPVFVFSWMEVRWALAVRSMLSFLGLELKGCCIS